LGLTNLFCTGKKSQEIIGKIISKCYDARFYLQKLAEGKRNHAENHARVVHAYINLKDLSPNRRIFLVVSILVRAGFKIHIRLRLRQYLRWNKYGKAILEYPTVYPVNSAPTRYDLYVTDTEERNIVKTIHVHYGTDDLTKEEIARSLYFPIMQHPNLLKYEMDREELPDYASYDRDILIFFAGNMDQATYDKTHFQTTYGIENRYILARALIESQVLSGTVKFYTSYRAFIKDLEAGLLADKVVLFDASVDRIPQEQWLPLMGRSTFFLALPGYTQPFCHNIVEAMMTATVPVTEYGHLFFPVLRHGKESIQFSGMNEFIQTIKEICDGRYNAMLHELRNSAQTYYRQHLSLDAAAESLLSFFGGKEAETSLVIARAV